MSTQSASPDLPLGGSSAPERSHEGLGPAIDSEVGGIDVMGLGALGYYRSDAGEGAPVVLIHSINAAASSYEMRPLFEAFRGKRPVYALDLPGFGRSKRGDREYSADLYSRAIERFIIDVASPKGVPVDAVALSLSSEFLARTANRAPELFQSLTLLSPTGFDGRHRGSSPIGLRAKLLKLPGVSDALFAALGTTASVRYFLQKSFTKAPDEGLVKYAHESATKVPGGKYAPLTFLSGSLFTPDAEKSLYGALKVPTRVVYDQDPYTRFDRLDAVCQSNPKVTAAPVRPSRGMAHFEHTAAVVSEIERMGAKS